MDMLDFTVLIEQDEDGFYIAKIPELEGCYSQGNTLEEVLARVKEAAEVCIEGDAEEVSPVRFVGIQKIQIERPLLA